MVTNHRFGIEEKGQCRQMFHVKQPHGNDWQVEAMFHVEHGFMETNGRVVVKPSETRG